MLGRPGANVTLTCGAEEPLNGSVAWRTEKRAPAGGRLLPGGHALLLQRLQVEDAGLYSCHAGGRTLRTLRLLVEGGSVPGLPWSIACSGHPPPHPTPPRAPARSPPPLPPCLAEPPETPHVSCYRRSHDKDVLCEWRLRAKPSPGTRAMLWVKRR